MLTTGETINLARQNMNVSVEDLAKELKISPESVRWKLYEYDEFTEDELTILTKLLHIGMDSVTTDIDGAKELNNIYSSMSSNCRKLLLDYARMLSGH